MEGYMDNQVIIFIHIPKTAGTTFRNIVSNQYDANEMKSFYSGYQDASKKLIRMKKRNTRMLKWIHGHFHFGLHELIPKPAKYVAMLREPVDRTLSLYYFLRKNSNHPHHQKVKLLSLEQFVHSQDSFIYPQINNTQTLLLSGDGTPNLEKAKENIEKHFMFVGLTEHFDQSVHFLRKNLGWKNNKYHKQNVTPGRPQKEQVSNEILDYIAAKNEIDMQLYEYVEKLFQEKIESLR
jgi:hypothetical protein